MDKDNQVEASATRETSGAMAAAREVQRALDLDIRVMDDTSAIAAIIYRHMRAESAGRKSIYDVPEVKEIAAALAAYFGDKWKGGQNLYDAVIDTVESAVPEASEEGQPLPQQDGEMDTITNIIVRASEEQSGECYNAAHAKLIELVLDSKPQPDQWNEAIDELFSLISLDGGRWCFNSLSRDAPKFDAVMTRLSAIRALTRTSKEQEEAVQPGLGARGPVTHQGETK